MTQIIHIPLAPLLDVRAND